MGQDIFLKLGESNVNGSVTDAKHTDYIEITSFGLSVKNRQDKIQTDNESKLEGASIEALTFSKKFDDSSAKLLRLALNDGSMDNECVIHLCRPGGATTTSSGLSTYLEFTLKGASVQSYSLNAGGGAPNESFSLQFASISWTQYAENGTTSIASSTYTRPTSVLK